MDWRGLNRQYLIFVIYQKAEFCRDVTNVSLQTHHVEIWCYRFTVWTLKPPSTYKHIEWWDVYATGIRISQGAVKLRQNRTLDRKDRRRESGEPKSTGDPEKLTTSEPYFRYAATSAQIMVEKKAPFPPREQSGR